MTHPNDPRQFEQTPELVDSEAFAHFSDKLSGVRSAQTEAETLAEQTLQQIGGMAAAFALAMRQHQMPVTPVFEDHFDADMSQPRAVGQLVGRTTHPAWIVVSDRNLSGDPMTAATVLHEGVTWGITGEVNGMTRGRTDIDPAAVAQYDFAIGDRLRYDATSIVVTGMGRLLVAHKFLEEEVEEVPRNMNNLPYRVWHNGTLQVSHLIGTQELTVSKAISTVVEMRSRFDESIERYAQTKKAESGEDTLLRDDSYYQSEQRSVVQSIKPDLEPGRRGPLRRLLDAL